MPPALAIWSLVVGAISAVIGYRVGIHVQSSDGKDAERVARSHLAAWNNYTGALRELAVVRISNNTTIIDATYKQAISSSSALADNIGNHFGNVAADNFRLLLNEQVDNFDAIFVQVIADQDASVAVKTLYHTGRRFAEYLNNLTMLFHFHEASSMVKILFDRVIHIPIDHKRSGLTYETVNIDALFDHTAAVSKYFATTLSKYDRLKSYIAKV